MPSQDLRWLTERPIAHRGLHDLNRTVWENTLSAFSRAVEAGYAIECDLQYAADGVPVVFHDATLAAIAERAPATLEDLQGLSGIGSKKLEAYGADVLRVCAAF